MKTAGPGQAGEGTAESENGHESSPGTGGCQHRGRRHGGEGEDCQDVGGPQGQRGRRDGTDRQRGSAHDAGDPKSLAEAQR